MVNKTVYGLAKPEKMSTTAIAVECVYVPLITEVDVTRNTFKVKVDIDLSWKATDADISAHRQDSSNYIPEFVPDIVFDNSISLEIDKLVPMKGNVNYQIRGENNYIRQRFVGTCVNNYAVKNFPFDAQNLILVFTISFYDITQAYFHFPDKDCIYIPTRYTNIPGWTLERTFAGIINPGNFSTIVTVVQIKRKRRPFLFRLFSPLVVLNLSAFSGYTVDEKGERLNILITCLLSFIGMIYVLSTNVPMAGDSTVFDNYAMVSIFIVVLALGLNGYWDTSEHSFYVLITHISISVALHVYVVCKMLLCVRAANEKMKWNIHQVTKNYSFAPLTFNPYKEKTA
mmetsp:Transcript_14186/g.20259  ORF Transcript_14186/g.20259 Transcript_14186/m.20259 type:complete len:342 (-) Transcript_14186:155-1180(-)|eukprot:CAMPEP_0184870534 /NCGR_PEP_ID=MMETSP0580-20130426/37808_1 /TAXON_ID=1118495 /ORGANISM="Dactyliosolen fragilissimus" /LENGTH=341 /DNA_ID=CAMNT_0027372653 /DNA_START=67 /DNA_END=1092 /DNA_ORIENTATION=+